MCDQDEGSFYGKSTDTLNSDLSDFMSDSVGNVGKSYYDNISNVNDNNDNDQKSINKNNESNFINNDLKDFIDIQELKNFTTVKLSVLQNHILSTTLGLNSELNFIILFVSDIIDTLVTIVKNKNIDKNYENRTIFVDLIIYLRSSLLFLLYHKLFAEILFLDDTKRKSNDYDIIYSYENGTENKTNNDNNQDITNTIDDVRIHNNNGINDNNDMKRNFHIINKCNPLDLIEEFRIRCKIIIQQNEIFNEKEEMKVWSTYLIIEIYLASIISKYHLNNYGPKNNCNNVIITNDNNNMKDKNLDKKNEIDFQISKNLINKLLFFLGNNYENSNSLDNELSFLVNYDNSLTLFSITIFQICLKIPFNIITDNNNNNINNHTINKNKNNNINYNTNDNNDDNSNDDNYNKNNKQNDEKYFTTLELESAVRLILCVAGPDEENKNLPKKSKKNTATLLADFLFLLTCVLAKLY